MEAGGAVQGSPHYLELAANLGYVRPCLKTIIKKENKVQELVK